MIILLINKENDIILGSEWLYFKKLLLPNENILLWHILVDIFKLVGFIVETNSPFSELKELSL